MNSLQQIIAEKIKKEGPITFETFMDMALYHPDLGYYSCPRNIIGREGDFYTSPHLHPIFGAMIAKQLLEMWVIMGRPAEFYAVEIGAGAGYLCKDILDYLNSVPDDHELSGNKTDFMKSLKYIIVEPYMHFQKMQRELLVDYMTKSASSNSHLTDGRRARVQWVNSLKELRDIKGCIFSNELLDAFPVHLVEMNYELKEVYVDFDGTKLVEEKGALSSKEISDYVNQFSVIMDTGYRTEINLRIKRWLDEAASALSHGFLLTVDYGYTAREYYDEDRSGGTLLCYHRHRLNEDPFQDIGEQDITAHVNFSSLKRWGEDRGLNTLGYCAQGTFLTASGIDEVIIELYSRARDYLSEISKVKGLVLPQGMGESHRFMIQYKGEGTPELRGFSLRNLVKRL